MHRLGRSKFACAGRICFHSYLLLLRSRSRCHGAAARSSESSVELARCACCALLLYKSHHHTHAPSASGATSSTQRHQDVPPADTVAPARSTRPHQPIHILPYAIRDTRYIRHLLHHPPPHHQPSLNRGRAREMRGLASCDCRPLARCSNAAAPPAPRPAR